MSSCAIPTFLTGVGLGALIDGIVLHQVLQWHHLVVGLHPADTLAGLERNTFADGIFHLVAWLTVVIAVLWLGVRARDVHAWGRARFVGVLMVGWGAFHIVDHVVLHLALKAHHIRMVENYQVYDWSFFTLGVGFIAAGAFIARHRRFAEQHQ